MGMIFGILYSDKAEAMLEAWMVQPGNWKPLGGWGRLVDDSPVLASTRQAHELARSMYHTWPT